MKPFLLTLLSLAAVPAAWQGLVQPRSLQLAALRSQLALVEHDLSTEHATKADLSILERDNQQLEEAIERTGADFQNGENPQQVLDAVHDLTRDTTLVVSSFKPTAVSASEHGAGEAVELTLEGGYRDVCRFLDRAAQIPQRLSIAALEIKPDAGPNARGTVLASLTVAMVETSK